MGFGGQRTQRILHTLLGEGGGDGSTVGKWTMCCGRGGTEAMAPARASHGGDGCAQSLYNASNHACTHTTTNKWQLRGLPSHWWPFMRPSVVPLLVPWVRPSSAIL